MDNKLYNNKIYDAFVLLLDALILAGSYRFCLELFAIAEHITCIPLVCFAIILFFAFDMYDKTIRSRYELFLIVFLTVVIDCLVCSVASIAAFRENVGEICVFYTSIGIMSMCMLIIEKLVLLKFVRNIEGNPSLLVLESVKNGNKLAKKIKYSYSVLYEAYYEIIDDDSEEEVRNLIDTRMMEFDSIFISSSISFEVRNRIIERAFETGKPVYVLPDVVSVSILKSKMVQFDDTPALRLESLRFSKSQRIVKRIFDFLFSVVIGIISLPFSLVIMLLLSFESRECVIKTSKLLTTDKRPFTAYEFRTEAKGRDGKSSVTRFGSFLIRTHLRSLPKLLNVFLGHISVVGPRPESISDAQKHIRLIQNYDKRFYVKAGLTGLAQVYGKKKTAEADMTIYDIMYIREYSFFLDIKIMLMSLKALFMQAEVSDDIDANYMRTDDINAVAASEYESAEAEKTDSGTDDEL